MEYENNCSEFKSRSGVARIPSAFRFSLQGLKHAWTAEHAFRQELFVAVPGTLLALSLPVGRLEKLALVAALLLVLVVELLNSAIEAAVDRISLEPHPLSGTAKDVGSAAVFLTVVLAALTWVVIVVPVFLP